MRLLINKLGLWSSLTGILLLFPMVFGVSVLASKPPDFSGKWQINHDKSDDARTKIRDAMSGGGPFGRRGGMGGGGGGMGGGGWPGRQGGGGYGTPPFGGGGTQGGNYPQGGSTQGGSQDGSADDPNGQDPQQRQQRRAGNFAYLLNEPETLDIAHKEPLLTINQTFAEDQGQPATRAIYTDGRSMDQKDAQGDQQQSKAKWDGKKLVLETKDDRGTITETYELESGGKELRVTTKVVNARLGKSVTVKRIYDPTKPDAPKADAAKSD